jgi:hypothetical protein
MPISTFPDSGSFAAGKHHSWKQSDEGASDEQRSLDAAFGPEEHRSSISATASSARWFWQVHWLSMTDSSHPREQDGQHQRRGARCAQRSVRPLQNGSTWLVEKAGPAVAAASRCRRIPFVRDPCRFSKARSSSLTMDRARLGRVTVDFRTARCVFGRRTRPNLVVPRIVAVLPFMLQFVTLQPD